MGFGAVRTTSIASPPSHLILAIRPPMESSNRRLSDIIPVAHLLLAALLSGRCAGAATSGANGSSALHVLLAYGNTTANTAGQSRGCRPNHPARVHRGVLGFQRFDHLRCLAIATVALLPRPHPAVAIGAGVQQETMLMLGGVSPTVPGTAPGTEPTSFAALARNVDPDLGRSVAEALGPDSNLPFDELVEQMDVQYHGFLADPFENLRMMQVAFERMSREHATRVHLIGYALSNVTTSLRMPFGKGVSGSTFNQPAGSLGLGFSVPAEDIASVMARVMRFSNAQRLFLLEINCEGCEYILLPRLLSLGPETVSRIDLITVQYHGHKRHHSVPSGFEIIKCKVERCLKETHIPLMLLDFTWEIWVSRMLLSSPI